jgi:hypothetical protein
MRTLAIAAAVVFSAEAAAPQSAVLSPSHDHSGRAAMTPPQDGGAATANVREQIRALDTRIKMLATDMRMFSGEMKVEIMASLLTAMIERQSLMASEMKTMREGMMRRVMERNELPAASFDEEESGGMCAPSN